MSYECTECNYIWKIDFDRCLRCGNKGRKLKSKKIKNAEQDNETEKSFRTKRRSC